MTTIGVSVAVPEPWGTQLQQYRVRLGEGDAARIPSHITLLPPVDIDPACLPEVYEHLDVVASGTVPFEMHLRGTGTFRPVSPVVFVNVVRGISSCEQLSFKVRRGPLALESQFPYHPHVTVAHNLEEPLLDRAFEDLERFDCRFTVDHFSLYVHEDPRGWTPVRDFRLGGRVAPAAAPAHSER